MPPYSATRAAFAPSSPAHEHDLWPRAVHELADDLAVDASARDRAGEPPFDEVARLREAGIPPFMAPPGPDGNGTDWRTACAVVRTIAAADSSVAELLAHHYVMSWGPRLFGAPEHAARLEARSAREQWLWAGSTDSPGGADEAGLLLSPRGEEYVLSGECAVPAGAAVADRLLLSAAHSGTGETVIVHLAASDTGMPAGAADDRLGQRLTGGAVVGCEAVPVPAGQVLGTVPADEHTIAPHTALAPLLRRLILLHVGLGNAEGALDEARDVNRVTSRPSGPYTATGDDPYLLLAFGELATAAHSAASVVERATDAMAQALLAGAGLGDGERGDVAFLVDAAEAVTTESALHITTRILEITSGGGSRSRTADPGFDRFWRNARTLTARSSPSHRLRDIGAHYLNGPLPQHA